MPKAKKTAPELAELVKGRLVARGFNAVRVQVSRDSHLGWRAAAISALHITDYVTAAVDEICRELRGLYDLA